MRPGFDPWVGKIPWRRKWPPTPVFLPGETHGHRSLVGCSSRGRKELNKTERLSFLSLTDNFTLYMLIDMTHVWWKLCYIASYVEIYTLLFPFVLLHLLCYLRKFSVFSICLNLYSTLHRTPSLFSLHSTI